MRHTLTPPNLRARFARWLTEAPPDPARMASQAAFTMLGADDLVILAGGVPAAELFPIPALERAFAQALHQHAVHSLSYGPIAGALPLRELVCQRLARQGIQTTPDQVLITSGATQGLYLLGRVLLEPGDPVITEAPTFLGAFDSWEPAQPRYLPVAVDEDGLRLDVLADTLRATCTPPKFVYTLPTFQNPAGVTLSVARRYRLLEMADAHDLLVVEDDPYGELWFDDGPLPPLRSLPGGEQRVVYLGSFSKILAPGLRLGYVVAQPELLEALVRAKTSVDLHSDGVAQYALARLFADPSFDVEQHLARMRAVYRDRRDALLTALRRHMPAGVTWTQPRGGFFVWVELPRHLDGLEVLRAALAQGVAILPGSPFYPQDGDPQTRGGAHALRLSYSNTPPERIQLGVERLASVVRSLLAPAQRGSEQHPAHTEPPRVTLLRSRTRGADQ